MKDQNSSNIRVTEGDKNDEPKNRKLTIDQLKKPVICFLMTIVCAGCLYLIFNPKEEKDHSAKIGFNSVIPQASDGQLQSDKQKAYEQQLLEQKNEEKKNALTTLSDYWTDSSQGTSVPNAILLQNESGAAQVSNQNPTSSYRNAQQALSSFYSRDDQEVNTLKREIHRLKTEASQREAVPAGTSVNDQLELMERSYQLAAKYLPASKQEVSENKSEIKEISASAEARITVATPVTHSVVSSLYRDYPDSIIFRSLNDKRFTGIQDEQFQESIPGNSIRAAIHETKIVTSESMVAIRLLESIMLGKVKLPVGTVLKAKANFQGGRLHLNVSTIAYGGIIEPVDINIHDNDGQLGLYISYSSEQNALTDIAANMGQNSGTNIMMTRSAGQQMAADLTKGLIQGVSGYFQKKVRQQKVTVKTGHLVFLVSKNN
ncbi:conjugative transposon TraM protein [Chryseobacterium vietnamense]|uniref:Conjugative transposon TraM protein n=1 Tax=Chryseobacterium vietnamense TaxID=866785 RepID=A0ACC6JBR8_9FLAO|nr:conjugative transposon protein TraM [Chryseobacterium vietnamense]MDR6460489.1 conjugative transposon TraM protein [Chryseobacterium vietnamense]